MYIILIEEKQRSARNEPKCIKQMVWIAEKKVELYESSYSIEKIIYYYWFSLESKIPI